MKLEKKIEFNKIWFPIIAIVISAIYVNLIPNYNKSDSAMLVGIHLPMFLWSILGYAYIGAKLNDHPRKIEFLKFNGDLIIMCAIILLSCMVFTLITFGLFELINIKIEENYFKYFAVIPIKIRFNFIKSRHHTSIGYFIFIIKINFVNFGFC